MTDKQTTDPVAALKALSTKSYTEDNITKPDMVNHPPHYITESGIEAIDVIEAFELGFKDGNCVKYVLRHKRKASPLEDLKKARWYLDRYIAEIEAAMTQKTEQE